MTTGRCLLRTARGLHIPADSEVKGIDLGLPRNLLTSVSGRCPVQNVYAV